MSDPSHFTVTWKRVFAINLGFLLGVLAMGLGWLCWNAASPELWGLWVAGGMGLVGGGARIIESLCDVFKYALLPCPWRILARGVSAQKADPKPARQSLRDGGIIR